MIYSGKKAIITPMDVHRYMKLAYEFWNSRERAGRFDDFDVNLSTAFKGNPKDNDLYASVIKDD